MSHFDSLLMTFISFCTHSALRTTMSFISRPTPLIGQILNLTNIEKVKKQIQNQRRDLLTDLLCYSNNHSTALYLSFFSIIVTNSKLFTVSDGFHPFFGNSLREEIFH